LSKTITRADGQPNELQSQLNAISKTSREVLQNLDEIVWAVDPKNDTLEKLVAYIAETAAEYFEMTNIECKVEIPASLPSLMVSSHVRHHLFSVVQEALTNTLKHSQATRTTIQMNCAPDVFEIVISDNGHGFELSRDNKPGHLEYRNGLRNMSQRMTEIGGQCVVQSEPGRGTSLRLSIPLNDSH
jgi:signal transduction histidine kinase